MFQLPVVVNARNYPHSGSSQTTVPCVHMSAGPDSEPDCEGNRAAGFSGCQRTDSILFNSPTSSMLLSLKQEPSLLHGYIKCFLPFKLNIVEQFKKYASCPACQTGVKVLN